MKKLVLIVYILSFVILNVFAQPALTTSPSGIVDLCGTVTTTTLVASPSGAVSYEWYKFGCMFMPQASGQSFNAPSGDWYCVATWSGGLQSSSPPVRVRALQDFNTVIMPFPPPQICSGSGYTMYVGPGLCIPGTFWSSYQWKLNGVNIPGATNYSYTGTSSGLYSCQVSNTCGSIVTGAIQLNFVSPVVSGTTITVNSSCGILSVPNVSGNGYQWLKSGATITGGTTYQYTIPSGQSGSYSCRISNVCNTVTTAAVSAAAPVALSVNAGGPLSFCQGNSVVLTASYAAPAYTFQWKNNGTAIVGATGQSYTATSSGSYSVTASSASCSFTSTAVTVTANPIPVVSFSGLNSSYTTLSAPVTLVGTPAGGVFSGAGISGSVFSPANAGAGGPYSITYSYTSPAGCSASQSQTTTVTAGYNCSVPSNVNITNIATTSARINWSGATAPQFRIRFRKVGTGPYTTRTFTWTSGTFSYVLTGLKKNTNYEVSLQSLCSSGNSAYSTSITFRTLSAPAREVNPTMENSVIESTEISIYPNPVHSMLSVSFGDNSVASEHFFELIDMTGKIIQSGRIVENSVNVERMEKGIYFIRIYTAEKSKTLRFIKE